MNTRCQVKEAIRLAGCTAYIPGREDKPFFASIQPMRLFADDAPTSAGFGPDRRYELFIPRGGNANLLEEGDCLISMGRRYLVLRLEPICLDDDILLRRGVAALEQEAGY